MLNKKHVDEFRNIVKEEYGHDLSDKQAENIANGLVDYFDLLAKMYHQSKIKK